MAAVPDPGAPRAAPAFVPRGWPRELVQPLLRFGPPYSRGEDVFSLPPGALVSVLACLKPSDTAGLRLVCRAAETHVASHRWSDLTSPVRDLARWRVCFPRAVGVKLHPQALRGEHLRFLEGLRVLDVGGVGRLSSAAQAALGRIPFVRLHGSPAALLLTLLTSTPPASSMATAAFNALSSLGAEGSVVAPADVPRLVVALREAASPRQALALCQGLARLAANSAELANAIADAGGMQTLCTTVTAHSSASPAAAEAAAGALCNLSARLPEATADATAALVQTLNTCTTKAHEPLAAAACSTLCNLCSGSSTRSAALTAAGGVAAVAAAARTYPALRLPTLQLLYAMACTSRAACREITAANGLALAAAALSAHDGAPPHACATAALLVTTMVDHSAPRTAAFVEAGGIGGLFAALKSHGAAPSIAALLLRLLHHLALHSSERSLAITAAGGVKHITTALRKHMADAAIVEVAAQALGAVFSEADDKAKTAALASGTHRALLTALERHTALSAPSTCVALCNTTQDLAWNSKECSDALVDVGVIKVVLPAALQAREARTECVEAAARVLWNITFASEKGKEALVAAPEGLHAIVAVLRGRGTAAAGLAEALCGVARNLATGDQPRRASMMAANVAPALITAMDAHPNVPSVCEAAAWAIRNLASKSEPRAASLFEAGAARVLLAALHKHTASSPGVATATCFALQDLVWQSEARGGELLRAGGEAAAAAALQAHPECAPLASAACALLRNLAAGCGEGGFSDWRAGAPAVAVALTQHASNKSVGEAGCWALRNMAATPAGAATVVAAGGAKAVAKVLVHTGEPAVHSVAEATLRTLAPAAPAHLREVLADPAVQAALERGQRVLGGSG